MLDGSSASKVAMLASHKCLFIDRDKMLEQECNFYDYFLGFLILKASHTSKQGQFSGRG